MFCGTPHISPQLLQPGPFSHLISLGSSALSKSLDLRWNFGLEFCLEFQCFPRALPVSPLSLVSQTANGSPLLSLHFSIFWTELCSLPCQWFGVFICTIVSLVDSNVFVFLNDSQPLFWCSSILLHQSLEGDVDTVLGSFE